MNHNGGKNTDIELHKEDAKENIIAMKIPSWNVAPSDAQAEKQAAITNTVQQQIIKVERFKKNQTKLL